MRLGCGVKGSDNDFHALKSHPFFEGVDWENLPNLKPPVGNIVYNPKPANMHSFSPNSRRNNCLLSPVKPVKKKDTLSDKELLPFKINLIAMENIDKIIFECILFITLAIVQKKSPWLHYNTQLLKLHSNGKLEYIEPESHVVKGTIKLDSTCRPIFNDDYNFDIITSSRRFVFKVTIINLSSMRI
jgi:hypothetical protein